VQKLQRRKLHDGPKATLDDWKAWYVPCSERLPGAVNP
jgi:hypothetical protein